MSDTGPIPVTDNEELSEEELNLFANVVGKTMPHDFLMDKQRKTFQFNDLYIRTKEIGVVPFHLNTMQKTYCSQILLPGKDPYQLDVRKLVGIREYDLKARQLGITTFWLGLYALKTWTIPHTRTVLMAHQDNTSKTFLETILCMWENLDPKYRPKLTSKTKDTLYWGDLDSEIKCYTAGSGEIGRGTTVHNFLGSEFALWPNPSTIMNGVLNAVPTHTGNAVLETTANGVGNYAHQLWLNSIERKVPWKPRFFPWAKFPEYRITIRDIYEKDNFSHLRGLENDLSKKEKELMVSMGLSIEQIMWRKHKISEGGDFQQEYPLTWQEAFAASTTSYFDKELVETLNIRINGRNKKPFREYLAKWEFGVYAKLSRHLKNGLVRIYKDVDPSHRYLLTADVAEGLNHDGDHDFGNIDIYDINTWEQVGQVHGQWPTHNFAEICALLGRYYNMGLLMIERNNHGSAVLLALEHHIHYPRRKLYEAEDKKLGHLTTFKSKVESLQMTEELLADNSLKIWSKETISECQTFVKLPDGKAGAVKGCFDDRVTSLIMAGRWFYRNSGRRLQTPQVGGEKKFYRKPAVSNNRNFTPPMHPNLPFHR